MIVHLPCEPLKAYPVTQVPAYQEAKPIIGNVLRLVEDLCQRRFQALVYYIPRISATLRRTMRYR
jgi:hypothetical protein